MDPSTSKNSDAVCAVCAVCHHSQAIYTCPRCTIRTCSLPCSKSHKSSRSCSGERDKTAYVPMNEYGWGTMANDYTYLEEVGRKAAEWGLDIVKGAFWTSAVQASRGRGQGRGRGRGMERRALWGGGRGNRDVLRMYLDATDIDMEILPPGMQRRRVNQSMWDAKSKSPLMTVEFVFHGAKDPFAPGGSPEHLPFALLTHRNNLRAKISDIMHRHFRNCCKEGDIPSWVESLISSPENEDTELVYLMCQHSDTPLNPFPKVYHKLDSKQNLLQALRNRTFVEYPTIDIWEEGEFTGALVEADGTFVEGEEEQQPVKRRRLDAVGGRKLIKGLLGGYTSNEEEEEEEENVLKLLGGYGSDEESLKSVKLEDEESKSVELEDGESLKSVKLEEDRDSEYSIEEPALEDIRDIFESIGHDSFTEDYAQWKDEVEEAEVDWSDCTDDEAELERILQRQKALHEHI